jgi:ABC-2 type transport system ATP-binding protein
VTEPVISVRGLHKSYGDTEAVRGIDLEVTGGQVFAFLGPNGAGKTTTVEILEGYRERSSGEVSVLGQDPASAGGDWRQRIGIVLQQSKMPPELSVRETLDLFAGYYARPRGVTETIDLVGLTEKAGTRVGKLSGGQQRRLDVALALVGDPELLFLDEPTTGFDPSARHQAWSVISRLRTLGKTIVLTTHYMEEAEALADRVAVVVGGRIVAEGVPESLGGRDRAPARIRFKLPDGADVEQLPDLASGHVSVDDGDRVEIADADLDCLGGLLDRARDQGLDLPGLTVERPSLEDVYLQLTGGVR